MVFAKYSSQPFFPDLFFIVPSINTSTNHAIYQSLNILLLPILHIQQLVLNCPITVKSTHQVKLNKKMFLPQGIYNLRRKLVALPSESVNSLEQKHCLKQFSRHDTGNFTVSCERQKFYNQPLYDISTSSRGGLETSIIYQLCSLEPIT